MSRFQDFDSVVGTSNIPKKKPGRLRLWLVSKISVDGIDTGRNMSKTERKKLEEFFTNTAQELISNNTQDEFILESSRKLLVQQRIMDDTKARRRLEGWARNTIIWYLVVVFALVILNGLSQIIWPCIFNEHGFISDTVMTVILSTTTINIIGLGVIVLRGHFPNYAAEEESKNPT